MFVKPQAKSVLITGAATGIGKDTARSLLERGHKVYATTQYDSQVAPLQEALGPNAIVFKLDIADADDRATIADLDLDVLINNAGQGEAGSLAEIDLDRVRRLFEVNLFSSLAPTQIDIKSMIRPAAGTIVFNSSAARRIPLPFLMPYSMTKFALSAAAAGLRSEMKTLGKKIHICVVEPGAYHTGFNQRLSDSRFEWMKNGSIFSDKQIEEMKADADRSFRWVESRSTASIVRKIVSAAEAKRPRLRYVAPWSTALAVRVLRTFGV